MTAKNRVWSRLILFLLLSISLACSLPELGRSTPTLPVIKASATPNPPTPTHMAPLPPALVEADPAPGAELPLDSPVTLYFNQPMDRSSVEAALQGLPQVEGQLTWQDDSTLSFQPNIPLMPDSQLTLRVEPSARSLEGQTLREPVEVSYQTVSFLQVTQQLPEPDSDEVDPSSAVVIAFNRPVVPLGADSASLPPAFTLDPPSQGKGEWLNTSTYGFYPDPALAGGQSYTVFVNDNLKGTQGSPLQNVEPWSFDTAAPRLVSAEPAAGDSYIPLDSPIVLRFNQPMDPLSVEAGFSLSAGSDLVTGTADWNEDFSELTFTPASLLRRAAIYQINLSGQVEALGGTPLGTALTQSFQTVQALAVETSQPVQGGIFRPEQVVSLTFNTLLDETTIQSSLTISPNVSNLTHWWSPEERTLRLRGDFSAGTAYVLSLSSSLSDPWGGTLGEQGYNLAFTTGDHAPALLVTTGSNILFLTPQDPSLKIQATNIFSLSLSLGSLPLQDFMRMAGPGGYEFLNAYQPGDVRTWSQSLELAPNRSQVVDLYLSPERTPLIPGLYHLRINTEQREFYGGPFLLVVSNIQTTFKISATDALVWAVDLRQNSPVAQTDVQIFDQNGTSISAGQTDSDGIYTTPIPAQDDPYTERFAVLGQIGQEDFGMGLTSWNQGAGPWEFGVPVDLNPPHLDLYLYSDRPIYRPGQTIYFRAIARQAYNGRYSLPDLGELPLTLYDDLGQELETFNLPLSAYGSGHGQFTLPENARPGYYNLRSSASEYKSLLIQVAEYRKPEINLQVTTTEAQLLYGQNLNAHIEARYFFDAPAGNADLHWALYARPSTFQLPGYQVGNQNIGWLEPFQQSSLGGSLGILLAEGDSQTRPDGTFELQLPANLESLDPSFNPPLDASQRMKFTLEVTVEDESDLPVSARTSVKVNPAEFYIGLRPDTWIGRSGESIGFDIQLVDWEQEPAGQQSLVAQFQKVVWVALPEKGRFGETLYEPQYTPVGSTDFATSPQGQARLAFTPPEPGTYLLSVSEGNARSEILLWVGGPGQAIWPNISDNRLQLTADRDVYQPGDAAEIFIPNPFGDQALALITVERGVVLRHQQQTVQGAGFNLSLPLSAEDAPNVYVSVTLIGRNADGGPAFRQGYVNLPVEPYEQLLDLSLTPLPPRAGPGEQVTLDVLVRDQGGSPVEGEFSLSVVDQAVLALADPNAPDIEDAYYGQQGLGVRTSLALAAYVREPEAAAPGLGGGGGGEALSPVVREQFPDTAYWQADLTTGPDGRAQVSLLLPDSLTTWQVDLRGLTADTRVGQAESQIITTKELLVRPQIPRFLVAGDHALLSAIIQNNTGEVRQVEINLQGSGFSLDEPDAGSQILPVPANGRSQVSWWGTVQDLPAADLLISARTVDDGIPLDDAARPTLGPLPILHYSAPQTFRTAGTLDEGGERLELVSLPRSLSSPAAGLSSGELRVELSPSLASAMLNGLEALEESPYDNSEAILSRFLPNLMAYRALQTFGMNSQDLQARLDRTLAVGLGQLYGLQNQDGGWGWAAESESDPSISAYILYGLSLTQEAGIPIKDGVVPAAINYLMAVFPPTGDLAASNAETWQFDQLAFGQFALAQAGAGQANEMQALFSRRDQLSPWAQALLAVGLERMNPGSEQARTLISDLQSGAIRSASGAHWDAGQQAERNLVTTLSGSGMVVYALAQRDPGSGLLADAVRYLMAHRQVGQGWGSSYASAWTLLALTEVMKGTGELGGDFGYQARINGAPLVSGQAGGADQLVPAAASLPVESLSPDAPNALTIQRDPGQGRLYYTAGLQVNLPVEQAGSLDRGLSISRYFYPDQVDCPAENCSQIEQAQLGDRVLVRVVLTLPGDVFYLQVEDHIPAGAEILDTSLKTSQQGQDLPPEFGPLPVEPVPLYDPRRPLVDGWGWWLFNGPRVYDDRIAWSADYLPAGTYELTYTLVTLQPGEYRVLPARAWETYFPEVQGQSAGAVFSILP
jgi:alpha-2-macroglobulin